VLDVIRWSVASIDLGTCNDISTVYAVTREAIEQELSAADGRGLALRLHLSGTTAVHNEIAVLGPAFREEIETIATTLSDDIWIENIEVATLSPRLPETTDPTVAGRIRAAVEEFARDPVLADILEKKLGEVREKMPAAAHTDELFASIKRDGPAHALNLALSLIETQQE
jgi:hypothetical protein